MQIRADNGDREGLRREAQETLARFPADSTAASWLARAAGLPLAPVPPPQTAMNADIYVAQSLAFYRAGKYPESIRAAQMALKLKPDYAEAWNNIGAAWNRMSRWDQGIAAEEQALRLKPDLQIARNNLAVALSAKQKAVRGSVQRSAQ